MSHLGRKTVAFICLLGLLPASLSALEPTQGKGKPDKHKSKSEKKDDREVEFVLEFLIDFTSDEAHRYAAESKLTGQKPLPPGIRKNLARGKPIPPGIAKQSFPSAFLKKLPAHDDYEWHMSGTDLLLVAKFDKLVVEIAADVFK